MTDRNRDRGGDSAYEVLAPLSSGTYGENLLAVRRDPLGIDKLFVLRQLRKNLSRDQAVRKAFVEGGRRAARLSHPNIGQTYELGERGGALVAVTEYLAGEPLDAIMSAVAPAPTAVDHRLWLLIACEALSGLHHAHELKDFDGSPLGIVHGGVTPKRIFVGFSGRVVLTEFGFSTLARHAKRLEGTFLPDMTAYKAPEQRAGRQCDRRADIFAIGLVLWELISGKRIRHSTDLETEIEPLPPLKELRPDTDWKLSAAIARAVNLDPATRFPTALEFRRALEAHADLSLLRRGALGDSIAALFERSREKIPSLLSRRVDALMPQNPADIALVAGDEPEEEQEEAFLLAQPIKEIDEDAVISVRELVSASELVASESATEGERESAPPESAMPISSAEILVPQDEGSGHAVETPRVALPAESAPAVTERSLIEEAVTSKNADTERSEGVESSHSLLAAAVASIAPTPNDVATHDADEEPISREIPKSEMPAEAPSTRSIAPEEESRPTLTEAGAPVLERDVEHLGSDPDLADKAAEPKSGDKPRAEQTEAD